jgi:hypothetical protein
MNQTAKVLHQLIGIFDPNQKPLPLIPFVTVSSLIQSTKNTIDQILKKKEAAENESDKGMFTIAGTFLQKMCVKGKPFMKVLLSVAVQASAVVYDI